MLGKGHKVLCFKWGKMSSIIPITVNMMATVRSAVPSSLIVCVWLPFYLQLPVQQSYCKEPSWLNYVWLMVLQSPYLLPTAELGVEKGRALIGLGGMDHC